MKRIVRFVEVLEFHNINIGSEVFVRNNGLCFGSTSFNKVCSWHYLPNYSTFFCRDLGNYFVLGVDRLTNSLLIEVFGSNLSKLITDVCVNINTHLYCGRYRKGTLSQGIRMSFMLPDFSKYTTRRSLKRELFKKPYILLRITRDLEMLVSFNMNDRQL